MADFEWATYRDKASRAYGGAPSQDQERQILEVFLLKPMAVTLELEAVADAVRNGKAKSGWGLARHKIVALLNVPHVVASDDSERDRALARELKWVRSCGAHFDRESEIADDWFGDLGRIRQWPELRDELIAAWHATQTNEGQQLPAPISG